MTLKNTTRIIEPWFLQRIKTKCLITNSLVSRGFVTHADNPDEIMITQEDINKCYGMDRTGWHANDYPMT